MAIFWSEIGSQFRDSAAHPHQEFPGVPPGLNKMNLKNGNIIDYYFTWYK